MTATAPAAPTGPHQAVVVDATAGMTGVHRYRLAMLSMILAAAGAMGGGRLIGDDSEKIAALETRVVSLERVHADEALLEKAMERLGHKIDKKGKTP